MNAAFGTHAAGRLFALACLACASPAPAQDGMRRASVTFAGGPTYYVKADSRDTCEAITATEFWKAEKAVNGLPGRLTVRCFAEVGRDLLVMKCGANGCETVLDRLPAAPPATQSVRKSLDQPPARRLLAQKRLG